MNISIRIILISFLVSFLTFGMLNHYVYVTTPAYDCSSPNFPSFPESVQEECIISLEQELRELIRKQLQEEARKKLIEV